MEPRGGMRMRLPVGSGKEGTGQRSGGQRRRGCRHDRRGAGGGGGGSAGVDVADAGR